MSIATPAGLSSSAVMRADVGPGDDATSELAARLSGLRVRRGQRDASRTSVLIGGVLAPLGLMLIGLAWLGASNTPILQEQIAYLISGGLFGLGLVIIGGLLYFSHWQSQLVLEARMQNRQLLSVVQTLQDLHADMARLGHVLPSSVDRSSTTLVATANGSMFHRSTCPAVRGKADVHPASEIELADLTACGICDPVG